MNIQIENVRALETLNWRSTDRIVEVFLRGLPPSPAESGQRQILLDAFARVPHPPDDAEWFREFEDFLRDDAPWSLVIAIVAAHLQRLIIRHDGDVRVDEQCQTTATVALECLEFEVGEACVRAAIRLADDLLKMQLIQLDRVLTELDAVREEYSLGSVTGPIVAAARRLRIPVHRLDGGSLVQLGHGVFQRRIRRSCTDATGYVAQLVSTDKSLVKSLWTQIGVPVPHGRIVVDAVDALRAAQEIGWPVVVKPCDADYGDGVSVGVTTEAGVRQAFDRANVEGSRVMIERQVPGDSYRLLVINQQVVSAVCRLPPFVVGDGSHTIKQLVGLANVDPRRGPDRRWSLFRLKSQNIDLALLDEQGLDLDGIPDQGRRVWLRRDIDINEGSSTHEVLKLVHADTLALACDAARVIGLDLAGIDLIARDISRPLAEQDGGFLEINSEPGIGLHIAPMCDEPRPVGESIMSALFGSDQLFRIPFSLVVGDITDHATLRSLVGGLTKPAGPVATSTPGRTQLEDRRLFPCTPSLAHRISAMLLHPRTAAACATTTLAELIESGLGTDQCDVIILANSGLVSIDESRWSMGILKSLMDRLLNHCDRCVLNVHDPVWSALITPGTKAVVMIAESENHPAIKAHAKAGEAVFVMDGSTRHQDFPDADLRRLLSRFVGVKRLRRLVVSKH